MKQLFYIITFLSLFSQSFAKQVTDSTAQKVALNFLNFKTDHPKGIIESSNLQLNYTAKGWIKTNDGANVLTNLFYVFNIISSKGFVIIAADDNALPVLGYSYNNVFDSANLHVSIVEWLDSYKKQLQSIIQNHINATSQIEQQWQNLLTSRNSSVSQPQSSVAVVGPLLKTLWDQNPNNYIYKDSIITTSKGGNYNALCPYDYSKNKRCVTGCGATAMAQVMKYWNYPTKGIGFHSYTPNNAQLGTLSVNFGNTTYDWNNMPDSLTINASSTKTNALAKLIYHCGVSINMDYGAYESISYIFGGPSTNIESALKQNFGYSPLLKSVKQSSYTSVQWSNLIKNELDSLRPMLYCGQDNHANLGGHIFVLDGYDNNDLFHFNWGWSGYDDGYFAIGALNTNNNGWWNGSNCGLIGVKPETTSNYDLRLYYSQVIASSTSISYANPFTITTNIANYSTIAFNGDYCAAVFDDSSNFVDYVQILSGQTLSANSYYTNNLTFSSNGIYGMIPGNYSINIFYRPTGGNWVAVSNNGVNINYASITVVNNDNIALYDSIRVVGNHLVRGQSATVSLNIVNNGSTTFNGQYKVMLFDYYTGAYKETIGTKTTGTGLQSNYHYNTSLKFTTPSINSNQGTYILALAYQPTGDNNWYWGGSGSYLNPIIVNIEPTPQLPDIYEPNDSISQSYSLPTVYINDSSYVNTFGSNIHSSTDQDFYKIYLPKGYSFSIKPTLFDYYNNDSNGSYSLDGLFSFSTDSINWSGTFDDTMPNSITMAGGKTIYFHVSPNFQGQVGTYRLDVSLVRHSPYVSGSILTPLGATIPNVIVHARGDSFNSYINIPTNTFKIKLIGANDTISLSKNNDVKKANGVSTIDIALIQSHILQKSLLSSPFKIIAADVDNNALINTIDIVYIKRLILGLDTTFKGNRLWSFVDSGFIFSKPSNPFPYSSYRIYPNLTSNAYNRSFIGVKLGDVNFDWNNTIPRMAANKPVEIYYEDVNTTNQDIIKIPIRVKQFNKLIGIQFTLHYPNEALELIGIHNNTLSIEYAKHPQEGAISFVWNEAQNNPITLEDGSVLFEMTLKKKANLPSQTDIQLTDDITTIEAVDADFKLHNIIKTTGTIFNKSTKEANQTSPTSVITKETFEVSPNPTDGKVQIRFQSKKAQTIQFQLTNESGKIVFTQKYTSSIGENTLNYNLKQFHIPSGIYFFKALGIEGVEVKKLVIE